MPRWGCGPLSCPVPMLRCKMTSSQPQQCGVVVAVVAAMTAAVAAAAEKAGAVALVAEAVASLLPKKNHTLSFLQLQQH